LLVASRVALAVTLLQFCPRSHAALPDDTETTALKPEASKELTPAQMLDAQDPTDAHIASTVAELLQAYHYSQHPFDQEIASKFLDRYLDTLDYSHLYLLQSDIADFEPYRTNLQELTVTDHDTSPCWKIFARFMERATERITFVTNALATEKFDFTGHDRFVVNRHTLPYAQDVNEAHKFWNEELRCSYLDQLISSPDIQFTGPLTFDAKGGDVSLGSTSAGSSRIKSLPGDAKAPKPAEVALSRLISVSNEKANPLSFDYLPKTFLAKDGHEFAWLDVAANGSNATLRISLPSRDNLKKTTNDIYNASGKLLGDISFHHPKADTNDAAALEAVIHLDQKNLPEIYKTLTNHYVQLLKNYNELDRDRVFEMYMNSLARAYDPHSDYMGHMQAENFAIAMKLSLFGIGALLTQEDGYCKIQELKEGPAAKSGKMKPGDRIIAVAQTNAQAVDCVGMPLDKVVEMIRGPKGTQVTLTIIPSGAADSSVHKQVALIRDEIKLEDSAAKARLYEEPQGNGHPAMKLGVIDLPSFYADSDQPDMAALPGAGYVSKDTTTDVTRLIKRLKKEQVSGIILDLRHNGGGYLEEAIKLTGLFIPRGPVVQTKDPNGDIVTDSCRDASPLYDGPMVILTSRFSASASEILTGALQDYNRALIVGDHSTFGKGSVQTLQSLAPFLRQRHLDYAYDPGSLKITIKKFYRAGGVSTQLKGVVSDIELPSIWNYATDEVGESSLPNAMPCDEVPSADPENLNRVKPYLSELEQYSAKRVAKDPDFNYIEQDIADFRKEEADKSISLNEAERLADQKSRAARAEARMKERLSRKKSDEKVFDITLKNADVAQLQPVPVKTNSIASASSQDFDDDPSADTDSGSEDTLDLDPTLAETRHILADYVSMINKEPIVSSK
jgi:carboxyl-terminal processing protease